MTELVYLSTILVERVNQVISNSEIKQVSSSKNLRNSNTSSSKNINQDKDNKDPNKPPSNTNNAIKSVKSEILTLGITKIITENSYSIKDLGLSLEQGILLTLLFMANPYKKEILEEKEKIIKIATKSGIFATKLENFIQYMLHLAWDSMNYLFLYPIIFEEDKVKELLQDSKEAVKLKRKSSVEFGKKMKEIAPSYSIDNFSFSFINSFMFENISRGNII